MCIESRVCEIEMTSKSQLDYVWKSGVVIGSLKWFFWCTQKYCFASFCLFIWSRSCALCTIAIIIDNLHLFPAYTITASSPCSPTISCYSPDYIPLLIIQFATEWGLEKDDLISRLSRVKGKLQVISLSGMGTADGKHLENFAYVQDSRVKSRCKCRFSREEPSVDTYASSGNKLWKTSSCIFH